jgi:hypothetical protein
MGRLSLFLVVRGEINYAAWRNRSAAANERYCVNQHASSVWRKLLLPLDDALMLTQCAPTIREKNYRVTDTFVFATEGRFGKKQPAFMALSACESGEDALRVPKTHAREEAHAGN